MENRAYYMFIVLQRWLSLRLDFFGNILVLGIGLFAAGFRRSVNPADVGVVLTYTLSCELYSSTANLFVLTSVTPVTGIFCEYQVKFNANNCLTTCVSQRR